MSDYITSFWSASGYHYWLLKSADGEILKSGRAESDTMAKECASAAIEVVRCGAEKKLPIPTTAALPATEALPQEADREDIPAQLRELKRIVRALLNEKRKGPSGKYIKAGMIMIAPGWAKRFDVESIARATGFGLPLVRTVIERLYENGIWKSDDGKWSLDCGWGELFTDEVEDVLTDDEKLRMCQIQFTLDVLVGTGEVKREGKNEEGEFVYRKAGY